jgi:hypothetical protein
MKELTIKSKTGYTPEEIFEALNDLERSINQEPTVIKKEERSKIISYYLRNRIGYKNIAIETRLEEISSKWLFNEINR